MATWIKANSKDYGVVSVIKPYTNKKGETFDAHFTENGKYLMRATDKNPIYYDGLFLSDRPKAKVVFKDPAGLVEFRKKRQKKADEEDNMTLNEFKVHLKKKADEEEDNMTLNHFKAKILKKTNGLA